MRTAFELARQATAGTQAPLLQRFLDLEGLAGPACSTHYHLGWLMPIDDGEFQSLLEQVRELHRRADELTRESTRTHENIRARLRWDGDPPTLPPEQRKLADEVVEVLSKRQLSSAQARKLYRAFFSR